MKKIKLLFFASFLSLLSFSASAVDITIARFFGDCEDAGSDTKATSGEACIIQSIINAFNEQNPDINVTTEVLDWGQTYNILQTRYADNSAPDIHIMHRHRIPQFSSIGAIADLSGELEKYGISKIVKVTPTFIFVKDKTEVGRIEGYNGQELFWWQVDEIIKSSSIK